MSSTSPWSLDGAIWFTTADVIERLEVSRRWFAYQRKRRKGSRVWDPGQTRPRGCRGTIGLWSPAQVAAMRSEILSERVQNPRLAAVDRLGHAREHRMTQQDLYALAWRLLRAGPFGDRLRRIGCDLPIKEIEPRRRAIVRAELVRALAAEGVRA